MRFHFRSDCSSTTKLEKFIARTLTLGRLPIESQAILSYLIIRVQRSDRLWNFAFSVPSILNPSKISKFVYCSKRATITTVGCHVSLVIFSFKSIVLFIILWGNALSISDLHQDLGVLNSINIVYIYLLRKYIYIVNTRDKVTKLVF